MRLKRKEGGTLIEPGFSKHGGTYPRAERERRPDGARRRNNLPLGAILRRAHGERRVLRSGLVGPGERAVRTRGRGHLDLCQKKNGKVTIHGSEVDKLDFSN